MKKIRYFAPNAKETIAGTGMDPETQTVICSDKENELMAFTVKVEICDYHLEPSDEEEHPILEEDLLPSIWIFRPQFLKDRKSFASEFFGDIYE